MLVLFFLILCFGWRLYKGLQLSKAAATTEARPPASDPESLETLEVPDPEAGVKSGPLGPILLGRHQMSVEALQCAEMLLVSKLPMNLPEYWKNMELKVMEHGWRAYPVDTAVLQTIKDIFVVRRPEELGKGRDALSYSSRYSGLEVHCAWRIENESAWQKFVAERQNVLRQMNQLRTNCIVLPAWESKVDAPSRDLPGQRFKEVGERYLLHGTKPEKVLDIIHGGFNEKHASDRVVYGAGNYCADEPEKVDQYATPDAGPRGLEELHARLYPSEGNVGNVHPGGDVFYCFLARVTCGACFQSRGLDRHLLKDAATGRDVYMTPARRELARIEGSSPSISYHTLVMHPSMNRTGGHVERFREVIVFDGNRIYPEYLVAYRRLK